MKSMETYHLFFAAGAFSQRKCLKIVENMRISRRSWKPWTHVVYSLPQAPFRKRNVQRNMKNMRISRRSWKNMKNIIYSLPQAPFRKKMFRKSWKYEKTKKIWKSSKNVQQIMNNMSISRKTWTNMNKCHLFFAAGAFSQNK